MPDSKHHHHGHDRHGAKQPERFNPARAAVLDDPARFEYLPVGEIVALLDPPTSGVVIDFGAGTGAYAIPLAQSRADLTVVALDEQPEMLAMLRAKPAASKLPNLSAVLTDQLATLRVSADRVLALNVFHELGDDALTGLKALLKPEGFAVFIDWNADAERPVGPPRDHVYSEREAAARLEQFGFACEVRRGMRYHYVVVARPR